LEGKPASKSADPGTDDGNAWFSHDDFLVSNHQASGAASTLSLRVADTGCAIQYPFGLK